MSNENGCMLFLTAAGVALAFAAWQFPVNSETSQSFFGSFNSDGSTAPPQKPSAPYIEYRSDVWWGNRVVRAVDGKEVVVQNFAYGPASLASPPSKRKLAAGWNNEIHVFGASPDFKQSIFFIMCSQI